MIKRLNLNFDKVCHFSKSFLQLSIIKADLTKMLQENTLDHYASETFAHITIKQLIQSNSKQI